MNSPMNIPSIIAIQWGGIAIAIICTAVAIWGFHEEWLDIVWVMTLAYTVVCSSVVAFAAWHSRWHLSDEFVTRTAKKLSRLDPKFAEIAINDHPRREDIQREIKRLARQ